MKMRDEPFTSMMMGAYVSLDRLPAGTRAVARQFRGGKEFAVRLAAMGLALSAHLEVLQTWGMAPCWCA